MVVLIRVVLVVCKIVVGDSDDTSEHEEWFEGSRWSVYKERLFGAGGFPFLLSLLIFVYSKACMTLTQLWLVSCLDPFDSNWKVSCPNSNLISCYQYHLHPTPPIKLKRVLHNIPDIECTVNFVWLLVVILLGTTVKLPIVTSWFAMWVAMILQNHMCLHPSNGCKYCNKPCSVACWVCFRPNHHWFNVCNDCVDELPQLTRFDIRQYPHRSPYSNLRVRQ